MFEEENVICLKKLNEIYFHVTCTVGQSLELKSYFQCYIKDHKFHPKVKKKIWNGKISFYKYREQQLPIGLLVPFTAFCKKFKYKYEIEEDHNPLTNSKANPPAIVEGCKQLFEGIKNSKGEPLFPYNYQMKAVYSAIKKKRGILMAATGCHVKGSQILMIDGSFKNVEDVQIGDKLMGPDNTERNVLKLYSGTQQMYEITPNKGKSFVVNEDHILHLKRINRNKSVSYVDISVGDYLKQNDNEKHLTKLKYNDESIDFVNKYDNETKLTPYFIGIYLGDGSVHNCQITTMDDEILNEVSNQIDKYDHMRYYIIDKNIGKAYDIKIRRKSGYDNEILNDFQKLGLNFGMSKKRIRLACHTKFVPNCIKYGTIKNRYEVLAGLIDSDGYLSNGSFYEFVSKSEKLSKDVAFIARSLGFFVSEKIKYNKKYDRNYYRCTIQGDIEKIPVRIKRKKKTKILNRNKCVHSHGFKVEPTLVDNYYGFQLDKDHLYLDDNFLIHHNSGKSMMCYILTRIFLSMNKKVLIVVPTTTLVEQMYTDYLSYGWYDIFRDVSKLYSEVEPDFTKNVLITTWQSVYKKPGAFFHQYGAVLFDECHYNRSDSLKRIASNCVNADYRIGTTGTLPDERVDQLNIYGYLGTVIFEQYSKELIDKGILAQIEIKNLILKYSDKAVSDCKNVSYHDEVSYANNYPQRKQIYEHIFNQYVKDGQNSLVLVNKISVLLDLEKTFKKKLDSKYKIYVVYGEVETEIREHIRLMTENSENVIILSTFQCFSTGINIKRLHNVIFGSSYKSKIKVLQSIGRGLRTHESKDKMMLFDIVDDLRWLSRNGVVHHNHLFNHFLERLNHYDKQKFKYHNVKIKL